MTKTILMLLVFLMTSLLLSSPNEPGSSFNGLTLGIGNLSRLSHARTRSISPENFTGEKGKGGMATKGTGAQAARDLGQGWKISPSVSIQSKQTFTLAEIQGPAVIQHIWVTPTGQWRFSLLRIY
jgi:D-arabinan exo alpha-(1,3)/(1,5)-arabinofuranosidase (non-reducing end)